MGVPVFYAVIFLGESFTFLKALLGIGSVVGPILLSLQHDKCPNLLRTCRRPDEAEPTPPGDKKPSGHGIRSIRVAPSVPNEDGTPPGYDKTPPGGNKIYDGDSKISDGDSKISDGDN